MFVLFCVGRDFATDRTLVQKGPIKYLQTSIIIIIIIIIVSKDMRKSKHKELFEEKNTQISVLLF